MRIKDEQLKRFVIDSGLVPRKDLDSAEKKAKEQKVPVATVLVNEGSISVDDLRRIESYVLGIPFISLADKKIDFDVLSLIPEPVARNHNIIAFKKHADALEVAMLDTADLPAIDFIKKKAGLRILPRLTTPESIHFALTQYQKSLEAEFGEIIKKESNTATLEISKQ